MQLVERFEYPADPEAVARMMADPGFVEVKVRATGALEQQVDVTGTADGAFTVTTRRSMPTDAIPANFRTLVGSVLDVRQVEAWEAPVGDVRHGTIVVEIAGAPVRLTGTSRLEPLDDGRTVLHIQGEVKASIPLFGSAVEQAAGGAVSAAVAAEHVTALEWLAER